MKRLIFALLIIYGCESLNLSVLEEVNVNAHKNEGQKEILDFSSYEERELYIEKGTQELKDQISIENKETFESYSQIAQRKYARLLEKVKKGEIKGKDNMYKHIDKLKEYVEIVIDENGEENV